MPLLRQASFTSLLALEDLAHGAWGICLEQGGNH